MTWLVRWQAPRPTWNLAMSSSFSSFFQLKLGEQLYASSLPTAAAAWRSVSGQHMQMQGNACRFRATHADSGQHMEIQGNTWRCRATHGDSGQRMEIQGNTWATHGDAGQRTEIQGNTCRFRATGTKWECGRESGKSPRERGSGFRVRARAGHRTQ